MRVKHGFELVLRSVGFREVGKERLVVSIIFCYFFRTFLRKDHNTLLDENDGKMNLPFTVKNHGC